MCSINRREDENRFGGSCGSRWEAATALMAGRRGGGDDTVTAASLLLREPGAGRRMNGGFRGRSALKGCQRSHPATSHVRPTQRAGGEGPESHLGLLAFRTFIPPRFRSADGGAGETEPERRCTHPARAAAAPLRFRSRPRHPSSSLIDSSQTLRQLVRKFVRKRSSRPRTEPRRRPGVSARRAANRWLIPGLPVRTQVSLHTFITQP